MLFIRLLKVDVKSHAPCLYGGYQCVSCRVHRPELLCSAPSMSHRIKSTPCQINGCESPFGFWTGENGREWEELIREVNGSGYQASRKQQLDLAAEERSSFLCW